MDTTKTENQPLTLGHIQWLGLKNHNGAFVRKGMEGEVQYYNGGFHYCVDNKAVKALKTEKDLNDIVIPIVNAEIRERNLLSKAIKIPVDDVLTMVKAHFGEGCYRICKERLKQVQKHGFTAKHHNEHPEWYENEQLQYASTTLLMHELEEQVEVDAHVPDGWDKEWFADLNRRTREERLVISATLNAAEIDRVTF